jgi:hypothetical protein
VKYFALAAITLALLCTLYTFVHFLACLVLRSRGVRVTVSPTLLATNALLLLAAVLCVVATIAGQGG